MHFHKAELLTYDDVLLVPQKSLNSRNEVNIGYNPIIPAPMSTVSGEKLCNEQLDLGGIAILNRYMSFEEKVRIHNAHITDMRKTHKLYIAVGADLDDIKKHIDAGITNFCVDIANGWSDKAIQCIQLIKDKAFLVIAGNIATTEGYNALKDAGADFIRVGIGGGSLCTTRIVSGHGYPNLSCIMNIYEDSFGDRFRPGIIADGGIRNSGDCVKALAAGAMYCMMGKYFANCEEAPGDIVEKDGKKYKVYAGMASSYVQEKVYGKIVAAPEGVSTLIPLGKKYKEAHDLLLKGIKSGMSYSHARTLDELRENAQFIKVSNNTLEENKPHGQQLKFEV